MRSNALRIGAPLGLLVVAAIGLAIAGQMVGDARVDRPDDDVASSERVDAGPPEPEPDLDAGPPPDASWRYRRGRLWRPPADDDFRCEQPQLDIPVADACAQGRPYPACRWRMPEPREDDPWEIWRNTTDEHRWARPGLVSLILTAATEYGRRWPGEHLTVGDLDAPGPRHQTHDRGVDVDLYLTEAMIARNDGGGRYPDNYENRSRREVNSLRARVMDLAKILATCANGQIRIYYNDPDLIRPFRAWFEEQGMHSDVGRPMRMHNELHRFHFHLTVPEEISPLPPRE